MEVAAMRTRTLVALLCGLAAAGATVAETIVIDDQLQLRQSSIDTPKRGVTMDEVEKRFGAPTTRHPAVGQPPITRWDYAGFSVFFEHDRVIHAVATSGESPAPSEPASHASSTTAPQSTSG
jgi:hypothetical protein